jgi:alkanesulfonate monooxygenase SsuD/methylene tetrahydromethanopterin reductase-like flavin-dependent oxidoreductase (luciferase family)
MELGIYTFGDITPDSKTGRAISTTQRYAEILAAAKLAEDAGLDVFGVGEHHRLDLPISSPAVVLAAIAGGTKRIRLSSAVTILSTLDPVRVFQDFATVDLVSGGRAELIAGRGAYIESFSLFGDDFANYDALFAEKLDLFLKLIDNERVTWKGRFRPPLTNSQVSPRPAGKLPIWLGVGGNPESALRAGDLGLPVSRRNHRLDQRPFGVGQITRITQVTSVSCTAVFMCPHRALLRESAPSNESQLIHSTQQVLGSALRGSRRRIHRPEWRRRWGALEKAVIAKPG